MKRRAVTGAVPEALNVIANELRGSLRPGSEFSGVLVPYGEDVEVEITVRVKHRVSMTQAAGYRARAMAVFALERWADRCPRWVKAGRDCLRKERQCSGKVSTVIVRRVREWEVGPLQPGENRRLLDGERFDFVCAHHADVNEPDVLAVVRLEQAHIRTIRSRRQREDAEIRASERTKERELEAEVRMLSDAELAQRLAEFTASHQWGAEDICLREQRRRNQGAATENGGIARAVADALGDTPPERAESKRELREWFNEMERR